MTTPQSQPERLDLRKVEQEMIRYGLQPDLSKTPAPHLRDDDEPEPPQHGGTNDH